MSRRKLLLVISLIMTLLGGCGGATPTSLATVLPPPTTPIPPNPPAVQPQPVIIATVRPINTTATPTADSTLTADGTLTPRPSPTLPPPIERPFLMRIDRISVVVGQGILLEGRVANGTLLAGGNVEILSPAGDVIRPSLLAVLISNTVRDQVTVGDYAGILVGGIKATGLSPGMLLGEAGEFESYQDALLQLQ